MKKNTLSTIAAVLSTVEFEGKDTVMAELSSELNRNAAASAEKAAAYETAKPIVFEAMRTIGQPATIADIYAEAEKELPDGFTKGKLQYAFRMWANEIKKIPSSKGAASYELA